MKDQMKTRDICIYRKFETVPGQVVRLGSKSPISPGGYFETAPNVSPDPVSSDHLKQTNSNKRAQVSDYLISLAEGLGFKPDLLSSETPTLIHLDKSRTEVHRDNDRWWVQFDGGERVELKCPDRDGNCLRQLADMVRFSGVKS